MIYDILHYLLVSLFVVMNGGGIILWDLIIVFFLTTFQLVCMWLLCLPQLRYWSWGGVGRPIAIMRCFFPKVRLYYYLGSFESNYIMIRNVEIWELLVE
jgi:hypothetical protein